MSMSFLLRRESDEILRVVESFLLACGPPFVHRLSFAGSKRGFLQKISNIHGGNDRLKPGKFLNINEHTDDETRQFLELFLLYSGSSILSNNVPFFLTRYIKWMSVLTFRP